RPCQVCEPLTPGPSAPNWLARLLAEMTQQPDLKLRDQDLRARGLDPVQVRRTFKRSFGMTFQAYQRACRLGTAMKALHGGARTLDAGLDAGFESDSGFREAFAKVFGDAPGRARDTALLVASWVETPLGPMLAIAGDGGLELLELGRKWKRAIVPGDHPLLERTAAQLAEYFSGARREFDIPLRLQGSPFQVAAWKALCDIRSEER